MWLFCLILVQQTLNERISAAWLHGPPIMWSFCGRYSTQPHIFRAWCKVKQSSCHVKNAIWWKCSIPISHADCHLSLSPSLIRCQLPSDDEWHREINKHRAACQQAHIGKQQKSKSEKRLCCVECGQQNKYKKEQMWPAAKRFAHTRKYTRYRHGCAHCLHFQPGTGFDSELHTIISLPFCL